ncbi:MAG: 4-(cytidine 5'-diphospho)-2-C-methyl-D-erythritol kinase, partial [Lentisphaeria bacterium]|nr:4-(cytidine 5'-diphospho)-2-C-methyl-D-erythritol kinase [Lentisphaeria bacterium]
SEMKSTGALNAVMSGSGPTLFALYKDAETLEKAKKALQDKYPEFQVITAEVLQ